MRHLMAELMQIPVGKRMVINRDSAGVRCWRHCAPIGVAKSTLIADALIESPRRPLLVAPLRLHRGVPP